MAMLFPETAFGNAFPKKPTTHHVLLEMITIPELDDYDHPGIYRYGNPLRNTHDTHTTMIGIAPTVDGLRYPHEAPPCPSIS